MLQNVYHVISRRGVTPTKSKLFTIIKNTFKVNKIWKNILQNDDHIIPRKIFTTTNE